jgi:hypothetical protein
LKFKPSTTTINEQQIGGLLTDNMVSNMIKESNEDDFISAPMLVENVVPIEQIKQDQNQPDVLNSPHLRSTKKTLYIELSSDDDDGDDSRSQISKKIKNESVLKVSESNVEANVEVPVKEHV